MQGDGRVNMSGNLGILTAIKWTDICRCGPDVHSFRGTFELRRLPPEYAADEMHPLGILGIEGKDSASWCDYCNSCLTRKDIIMMIAIQLLYFLLAAFCLGIYGIY